MDLDIAVTLPDGEGRKLALLYLVKVGLKRGLGELIQFQRPYGNPGPKYRWRALNG